ncbi:MAG: anaerobic ribonucleoside-triphosphate reductase [Acutalibacteraceae bacterium]
MKIIKRSGSEVVFDRDKIVVAVTKANDSVVPSSRMSEVQIRRIAEDVESAAMNINRSLTVEEIQDMVEDQIMNQRAFDVARRYITYRYNRALIRKSNTTDEQILSLIECNNEEVKQENSNKNPTVNSVQRDYMAGEVSKDITRRILLPADIVSAHEQGLIHFHDADYFAQHMHNCDLVNLEDMLQNGTVISGTLIEKPHSFSTACNIATQIIAQVASCQYGGQSISLTHLAPFVDISRKKIRKQVEEELREIGENVTEEQINTITEKRLRLEVQNGVQMIQYQVVTLMTTNGQAPFVTVFMYLNEAKNEQEKADLALIIEETLKQRYQGVKNEKGVWVTPAFPKLIYVLEEDNIHEGSKYYYLTKLAAKCTAKRMVPDYISEKVMLQNKIDKNGEGHCYTCMGCRSFLTPYVDENGKPKYYGRFNQGVVTVNLVDIGLSAQGDMKKFWEIFDERMELCHRALQCRHERLTGTLSDAAPILWQHGALLRLEKGETIDKYLHGGYSTLSLGYAGLWECVYSLNGKKLTEPEGEALGLDIMKKLNEYTAKWKAEENIDYSLYGTPLESTTYKFAKCLQKRFGIIKGVTDRNYITNSYHVHVTEEIDAFDKLALESKFQALSPGGAISYVEVPNMQNNLDAVLAVMQFIYDNIMYAELNTKSDFCQCCGYDGEIEIKEDEDGKLIWKCPNCGNTDQNKMNVARRTCGYIGTQFWNQGRTQEIKERVLHL